MSLLNVAATIGLIVTFSAFMLALAYAEHQTRSVSTGRGAGRK